jgi:hypothetical protein
MNYVEIFHENIIKSRSGVCMIDQEKQSIGEKSDLNKWRQFFVSGWWFYLVLYLSKNKCFFCF